MIFSTRQILLFLTLFLGAGQISASVTYQYFRFESHTLRGDGSENSIQLAELQIQFEGSRLGGASATNPGGNNPDSEPFVQTPEKAVDGDLSTKWLDFNKGPLVLDFGEPVTADSYAFATAGDAPDRDPTGWTLYGSDDGTNWEILDYLSDHDTTLDRSTWEQSFSLSEPFDMPDDQAEAVASTGLQAPGEQVPFMTIYGGRLTSGGDVLLSGGFSREGGEVINEGGVYLWEGGSLNLVKAIDLLSLESIERTVGLEGRINDSGDIFLYEKIVDTFSDEPQYDTSSDERIVEFIENDDNVIYAWEGISSVVDFPDYSLTHIVEPGFTNQPLTNRWRFNEEGLLAFYGRAKNDADEFLTALFIADGSSVEPVIRQGATAPIDGTSFAGLDSILDFGDEGRLLFRAGVEGETVDFNNDLGIFLYEPGLGTRLILQENIDGGTSEVENTYFLKLTDTGNVFAATLDADSLFTEIWTNAPGDGMEPVIESGYRAQRIPASLGFGSQARFEEITTFTVTEKGTVVFTAPVEEDAFYTPSGLGEGLFRWHEGSMEILLDEEAIVDGYEVGVRLDDSETRVFSNDSGNVVLYLRDVPILEGGERDGLLLHVPVSGEPEVIAETGGVLPISSGDLPQIRRIQAFTTNFGQEAIPTFINDNGQFLIRATYLNGGNGLFLFSLGTGEDLDLEVTSVDPVTEALSIQVEGSPGSAVTLEQSSDLDTWTTASSLQLDDSGSGSAQIPGSTDTDSRFYRAVEATP